MSQFSELSKPIDDANGDDLDISAESVDLPAEPVEDSMIKHRTLADTPLRKYFERAIKYEASDLLMRGDYVPRLRVRGSLKALNTKPIPIELFEKAIRGSLTKSQWTTFTQRGAIDLGVDFDLEDGSIHRFRINIFRTRGQTALAARRVVGAGADED